MQFNVDIILILPMSISSPTLFESQTESPKWSVRVIGLFPHKPIQVYTTCFLNQILRWPPPGHRIIIPITVVVEAGFGVSGCGAEAVGELIAAVCITDGVTEGVVFEVGGDGAGGGEVFADVAVAVVGGEIVESGRLIVDGFR